MMHQIKETIFTNDPRAGLPLSFLDIVTAFILDSWLKFALIFNSGDATESQKLC